MPESPHPDRGAPLITAMIVGLWLGLGACGVGESAFPGVQADEEERIALLAEPAASRLLQTLMGQVTGAVAEGGPESAMEFCSTRALSLTRDTEASIGGGLAMKRTSFRFRNPANAPDEAESEALLFFERAVARGGPAPARYVQRVSPEEVRYYKPLFVAEFCLQCHGEAEALDPGVRRVLSEKYPEDLATGYVAGDFRGVVRVSLPGEVEGGR